MFLLIKKDDFVNLDYTGRVEGKVFDLTDEALAKKEGIYDEKTRYGSVTVIVGAGHLLKGVDEALVGKKAGEEFELEIPPEKGFGKKNAKLLKIVPQRSFIEQKIDPYPGLTVNIDGLLGHVLSVSGGRVIVDFNHPLASKTLNYKVKINKLISDKKEQAQALIELYSDLDKENYHIELEEKKITIKSKKPFAENSKKAIDTDIKKYIKVENVEFVEDKGKELSSAGEDTKKLKSNGGKNEES